MIWLLGFFALVIISILLTKTDHENKISVQIIADSENELGQRLTTFLATFPRWILAEVNTHRMFSRNAASSRAIPIQQMLKAVIRHPAQFVFWGKNQAGMASDVELTGWRLWLVKKLAMWLRYPVCGLVFLMYKIGLHKQNANRYLEPWLYCTMIISATEWENFFKLRAHKAAQPEFQDLAWKMVRLHSKSVPKRLKTGEWHLPLITADDWKLVASGSGTGDVDTLRKVSVARCARVSYIKHDLVKQLDEDFKLHDRLASSGHFSPFEHVAQATPGVGYMGNFLGWTQHRKTLPNESGRSNE